LLAALIDILPGYFSCMFGLLHISSVPLLLLLLRPLLGLLLLLQGVNTGHILKTRGLTKHFTVSGLLVSCKSTVDSEMCQK
jgi:hypothetical protein